MFIVTPFSKPEYKSRFLANVRRQTVPPKAVIVVENGRGVGTFEGDELENMIVLKSAAHQSHAKNEGIELVARYGGGWITIFDCDDYYGPGYVAELTDRQERGAILGKLDTYVLDDVGLFLPVFNERTIIGRCPYLMGATQTFHTGDIKDIPGPYPVISPGEDTVFCTDFLVRGGKLIQLPPEGFCYMRTGSDRTWVEDVRSRVIRAGAEVQSLSDCLDEEIVNGRKRAA